MLRFILVSSLTAFALASQVCAQQMEDVVHLKNGSVIRGMIIEQVPDESLKIQTQDGSLFVYTMDEIAKASAKNQVVYLKNSSVIRGATIEQTLGVSLKVQTQDGSLFVYTMDEIARMAKEPKMGTDEHIPAKKDTPATWVEIGTLFGITRSESSTIMNMPGGSLFGGGSLPAFYVSWFPSERVAIGPEVNLGRYSNDGDSFTSLWLGCRAAFFLSSSSILRRPRGESRGGHALSAPSGNAMSGIYVLGQGSLFTVKSSLRNVSVDGDTDFSAGLGMGYLWRIDSVLTLRMEGQYRRWFDAESNNFSLVFGLGTRLGGVGH